MSRYIALFECGEIICAKSCPKSTSRTSYENEVVQPRLTIRSTLSNFGTPLGSDQHPPDLGWGDWWSYPASTTCWERHDCAVTVKKLVVRILSRMFMSNLITTLYNYFHARNQSSFLWHIQRTSLCRPTSHAKTPT
jgi:hypothetical protein